MMVLDGTIVNVAAAQARHDARIREGGSTRSQALVCVG
jgi:hypothetical protein